MLQTPLIRRVARRARRDVPGWGPPSRQPSSFQPAPSLLNARSVAATRDAFERSYLRKAPAGWVESAEGSAEIEREIVEKYDLCRRHVVPWAGGRVELKGATMVEIGCGTGAKTVAFGQHVERVIACDLSAPHLEAARGRVKAAGLTNVELHHESGSALLARVESTGDGQADVLLLFAVLEHMTLAERMETLERGFRTVRPGGLVVVAETPNRLLPWDWHSSRLPFFNQLPDELALRYYDRSPRTDYVASVRAGLERGEDEGLLALTRQGRGVSYHEFELALGEPLDRIVVGDGNDPEMVAMNPVVHDELVLKDFLNREGLAVPPGFSRYWLDLLIRRP